MNACIKLSSINQTKAIENWVILFISNRPFFNTIHSLKHLKNKNIKYYTSICIHISHKIIKSQYPTTFRPPNLAITTSTLRIYLPINLSNTHIPNRHTITSASKYNRT